MLIKVVKVNKKAVVLTAVIILMLLIAIAWSVGKIMGSKEKITESIGSFSFEDDVEIDKDLFNEEQLERIDVSVNVKNPQPTVLITHTHISEAYADGKTVEDAGKELARLFAEVYGVSVVHDVSIYDKVDGQIALEGAYERMEKNVLDILEKYPTIEVIIDLHRDAALEREVVICKINGKDMAPLMLVNGVCSKGDNKNPYLKENLALSLRMFKESKKDYDGLFRKNYIKPYRYSTHMKPCSVLVEVGYETNTFAEVENSLAPLAHTFIKAIE